MVVEVTRSVVVGVVVTVAVLVARRGAGATVVRVVR